MNLDEELKSALRPAAPRHDLLPGVLARLRATPQPVRSRRWQPLLAAVIVVALAAVGLLHWQQGRQQQARVAAQQLVGALHLASSELTAVRAKVVRAP